MSFEFLIPKWLELLGVWAWEEVNNISDAVETPTSSSNIISSSNTKVQNNEDISQTSTKFFPTPEKTPEWEIAELWKDVEKKAPLNKLKYDIKSTKVQIDLDWVQKQKVTPGRIAGNENNVRWGELHHNDKLPTLDWKIYSPVNGTVISIENNYKENKNWWNLKNASFWNYVIIKIEWGEFDWLTYHLGHIDKDIPLTIWDKVNIWQHIWNIKYGSWSGTWKHYSDAIWWTSATKMASSAHKWFEDFSSKLANVTIKDNWVAIYWDWSKDTSIA